MPLYDYQCNHCGHRFEVRQGIKEDPLTTCPQCGGPIRRVIHPVGVVFKGSGFYITDSRNQATATSGAGSARTDKPAPETAAGDKKSEGTSAPAGSAGSTSAETKKSESTNT